METVVLIIAFNFPSISDRLTRKDNLNPGHVHVKRTSSKHFSFIQRLSTANKDLFCIFCYVLSTNYIIFDNLFRNLAVFQTYPALTLYFIKIF